MSKPVPPRIIEQHADQNKKKTILDISLKIYCAIADRNTKCFSRTEMIEHANSAAKKLYELAMED